MQQRDQTDSPKVWPRTPDGWCSCPTCTALRDGTAERAPVTLSPWPRRMGGMPR